MKKNTAMATFAVAMILGSVGGAWAVPKVSNVEMQQIPGTRMVQINYDLADEAAIVTLSIETNGVTVQDLAMKWLSGDVCKVVQEGSRSIVWNAGMDWPENVTASAKARVTAWRMDAPPPVMVIDLTGGKDAATYPVAYYTSLEALPGGVTNAIYKHAYLVLRKISQGVFDMGAGALPVTLTNSFYTGVYQVTQGQWAQVMGTGVAAYFTDVTSKAYRPMEQVGYEDIRGAASDNPVVNWPLTDRTVVRASSFIGKLRARTGLAEFDLPTEAQWEYACRAGTRTYYSDGLGTATPDAVSNAQMNVLGRYQYNGGFVNNGTGTPPVNCGPANGTAIVGSYVPNAWGLYDTHGNVWEWCLDAFAGTLSGGTDPVGPVGSGTLERVARGGCWNNNAATSSSASRYNAGKPSRRSGSIGFRLVRTMP